MIRNVKPGDIQVSRRFRKTFGDIDALASSIQRIGLLHPIVVDSEFKLVVGGRRLKAIKKLKWDTVSVSVVESLDDALLAVQAEGDENTCRLDLQVSEKVELGLRLEKLEKPKAKERIATAGKSGKRGPSGTKKGSKKNTTLNNTNKTDAKVGEQIGMSHSTYRKAKEVIDSGDTAIIEEMDRSGKVGPAANKVKQKKKKAELRDKANQTKHLIEQPEWSLIHGDVCEMLGSRLDEQAYARLIFTDPPYNIGIDYGKGKKADKIESHLYLAWCNEWIQLCWNNLTDDGSFWLLVSDEYAAELCCIAKQVGFQRRAWIKWFEGFGVNCQSNFNRTTRHIFWFVVDPKNFVFNAHEVSRPSDRQTKYNDSRAASGGKLENDLWDIPRLTGTCNERIPSFPTQIPISIADRIVRCSSEPGDLVLDPFNGSGTTGVAAIQRGRKYIGVDQSEEFIELAHARLTTTEVLG